MRTPGAISAIHGEPAVKRAAEADPPALVPLYRFPVTDWFGYVLFAAILMALVYGLRKVERAMDHPWRLPKTDSSISLPPPPPPTDAPEH